MIPHPDKPRGWLKYDHDGYEKLLKQERDKRIELMIQIMKSRGVEYDLAAALKLQKEESEKEDTKFGQAMTPEVRDQLRAKYKAEEEQEALEARKKKSEQVKAWWASRR